MKRILFFTLFLFSFCVFSQFTIPEKPKEQKAVYDYAKILSQEENFSLENKLISYADSTSTQIVIVTIESLQGEYEGILAPNWAHKWGVGQEDKDNGVFILLAKQERKIWISPGYGLEHILTAGKSGNIIRQHIIPYFKQGDFYKGLDEGTSALISLFSGTYKEERTFSQEISFWDILPFLLVFCIFLYFIYISSKKNGGSSSGGTSSLDDLTDFIILSRMGRGGFGGGGFSGGGFGSSRGGGFGGGFGGGGFSGGGAGGSW